LSALSGAFVGNSRRRRGTSGGRGRDRGNPTDVRRLPRLALSGAGGAGGPSAFLKTPAPDPRA